ncbi:MAG: MotE family protein [Actinomycetota bacterium]
MARTQPKSPPKPKTPFVRLLPVLIGIGVLMLSVRVGDIWKGLSAGNGVSNVVSGAVSVAELQAQQPPRRGAPLPPQQQVAQAPDAGQAAQPSQTAAGPAATPAAAPAQAPATNAADQGGMSQTEMDVLQKLVERRNALDARERDIERREALMKAAEDQIERKVSEMKSLQNTIEGLLRQYNDQEDNKMRSLVKIYENMKPKEAAKIFEQLDMNIMLEVVERMKEQRVAPILAEMDPSKARAVTSELAQRRQIPVPKPASGG